MSVVRTKKGQGFVDEFVWVDNVEDYGVKISPRTCPYREYVITYYSDGSKSIAGVFWVKYVPKSQAQIEWEDNCMAPGYESALTSKEDPDAKEVWVALHPLPEESE